MSVNVLSRKLSSRYLPVDSQNEMCDWMESLISGFPEINIAETISQFAERKRVMSKGLTARPGKFTFEHNPFMREIADNASDSSPVIETYLQKPTQIGATVSILENILAYNVEYGIGPVLYVGGNDEMAAEQFEKRVDEAIEACGLQEKIKPNVNKKHKKTTGDRVSSKSYGGTWMRAIGPRSEDRAATFPSKVLLLDELDKYPVTLVKNGVDSGDIVMKLIRRQDSYGKMRKTIALTTPKDQAVSRIEPLVNQGDRRLYMGHCPGCGFQHSLEFKNFKWDKTEDGKPDVQYKEVDGIQIITHDPTYHECEKCGYKLKDKEKHDFLMDRIMGGSAEWVPTKKPERPFVRSYFINGLYSFRSWLDIALEYNRVKNDPLLWNDFVTDVMAETSKVSDEVPDENELMALSKEHEIWERGFISNKVIYLTLAADVQGDRLEAMLMGHGYNKQRWVIDYFTFYGDTSTIESQCWSDLADKIKQKYIREDGQELFIQYAGVDSNYRTSVVNLFCSQFPYNENVLSGVYPLQGRETMDKLAKKFKSDIKTPVLGIHDQAFKKALYQILKTRPLGVNVFPTQYIHISHEFGKEFYEQLTAEDVHIVKVNGVVKGTKILNLKNRRNEVLDVCKYNLALSEYAEDRYFETLNEYRKAQKHRPVQRDYDLFITEVESQLFN